MSPLDAAKAHEVMRQLGVKQVYPFFAVGNQVWTGWNEQHLRNVICSHY